MPTPDDRRHDDFLRLFTANEPALRGFVRSLVPTREDAREVMQEVALVLWRKFGAYATGEDFRKWAFGVARFEVLAWSRDRARDRHRFSAETVELLAEQSGTMADRFDAQRDALETCVEKLPAEQQKLVHAVYVEGRRADELAVRQGRTPMALYKTLHRIRLALLDCVRRTALSQGLLLLAATLALAIYNGPGRVAADEPAALRTLPAVDRPRLPVTDVVWPERPGEASICLWRDDAVAAVSFTIDDNAASDHEWWLDAGRKYDCRFTWFVITGRVGSGSPFDGRWSDFEKLRAAGHDVQSHTVDHFNVQFGPVLPTDENYRRSVEQLEANLPGLRALTLAYPGGAKAKNDSALAAKYFIAARASAGPINPAGKIDYQNVRSLVRCAPLEAASPTGLPNLIDPQTKYREAYRGWACMHFHGLDNPRLPELKASITAVLDYLSQHRREFWIGTFSEVAQYAQERDAASLRCVPSGDGGLRLTLTDRMDNRLFDAPLTVKVRLADGVSRVVALQSDRKLPVNVVDHDGGRYALLNIAPDRGDIVLQSVK